LQVILSILGLPEADYPRMIKLTQEMFGAEDPDLQRAVLSPEQMAEVVMDFYRYFTELTADRQAHPTDDLATLIANGTIDDAPDARAREDGLLRHHRHGRPRHHRRGDGRRAARARREPRPAQLLQGDLELLPNAVDEMIRWTAPVRTSCGPRRSTPRLRGRDRERRLALPVVPGRQPRPRGVRRTAAFRREASQRRQAHRVRLRHPLLPRRAACARRAPILFGQLVPRLESLELAGEPQTAKTTFVGGHKTVPIRYSLTAA
jgi:hypothetical protein